MSNINDYLLWRGDLSLKSSPLNSIDNMILARFSYMPFYKIQMEPIETVESISKKMISFEDKDFGYHGDKDLITNMGKSLRFKNMIVTDYEANTDKESQKQFSAITVHVDNNTMYLSFNGTDSSIIGWKEDFNLSFMENIPSQIEGTEYLKKQALKYNKNILMGGHSKGGNIAIYAGVNTSNEIKNRIISISNYDGPGFDKKIIESKNYQAILNKIITYIPQGSIIGRLLEHKETCIIVKSIQKGIYQHDIFSWQVIGTSPVFIKHVSNNSEFFNNTINTWLKETSPEQRKAFIDIIFEIFDSTNLSTFKEFSNAKFKNINILLKTYNNINDADKQIIKTMIGEFINSATKSIVETFKNKN